MGQKQKGVSGGIPPRNSMQDTVYPNYCPKCSVKFRVFRHPEAGWKPLLARYCPFCGEPVICPKCKKPYYECECDTKVKL